MAGPLNGIRVLEWAYYHVGPNCGAALADLGAEVIKIEDTSGGDPSRQSFRPNMKGPGDRSYYFDGFNRGKRAIAVNLKQEAGKEIVYRLVKKSDIFFSNLRKDAAQRLGMDYLTLRKYNSKLIYAHASGFGDRGPDRLNPAFDLAGQARAGILMAQVEPGGEPVTKTGMGDQIGSIALAFGILSALVARERTGIGQEVDTSIMGGIMWLNATTQMMTLFTGQGMGDWNLEKPENPQFTVYKAKDGQWLCLAGGGEQWWRPLCQAISRPDLIEDPRFKTREAMAEHTVELTDILRKAFLHKDRDEWIKAFREADYPAAPVHTPKSVVDDIQALENEYVVPWDHPFFGPVKLLGLPIHLTETPVNVRHRAPDYGEHTDEVVSQLAGYSAEEVKALRAQGVIK